MVLQKLWKTPHITKGPVRSLQNAESHIALCVCICAQSLSRVQLCATPQTGAHQAPVSMGSSRQEYWSELLFPSPGELLDPGLKPCLLYSQTDSLPLHNLVSPQFFSLE